MLLTGFPAGMLQCNCYILAARAGSDAIIVDPGQRAMGRIREILDENRLTPAAVLLTHGHYDHIGAVDAVCGHFGIPLYIHAGDAPKLTDPARSVAKTFGYDTVVATRPELLADGQVLTLAGMRITVLHTPGHSRGSVCYLLPDNAGLLCGDTLFDGGYGRYDFEDGDFSALKNSLRRILYMHPRMVAYPGHGGATFAGRDA